MNRPTIRLRLSILLLTLLFAGCDYFDHDHHTDHDQTDHHDSHSQNDDHGHGNDDSGIPAVVVTHYTDFTELFVEFPVLSVGSESPFAAHLTWLDNFQPVSAGKVRVILRGGDMPVEEFSIDQPSIPGIFRPVAIPEHAGEREVIVTLESEKQTSIHNLGYFTVYSSQQAIPPATEEEEGGAISYLKEQQWQVDFATTLVAKHTLRESIRAVATIKAAANGEAEISAPHDGQLAVKGKKFPSIGTKVKKGKVLAIVGTPLGRELNTTDKAISGSALRAPIAGVITHVHATAGSYLQKGEAVFHIIDPQKLWLESRIPESEVLRLGNVNGAWLSLPGVNDPFLINTSGKKANGRIVALSQAIDPRTRTVPFVLEFDNPGDMLRIGMLLEANVFTGKTVDSVAVPVSSVVRDNGVPVVYVELGGESFERRIVQPGISDGSLIEIKNGIAEGERVVSTGAYLVKLAASGPAEAGHGHAH